MGPSGTQVLFAETMILGPGSLRQNLSRTVQGVEMGPAGTQVAFAETGSLGPGLRFAEFVVVRIRKLAWFAEFRI
jgi:hypothetical protein